MQKGMYQMRTLRSTTTLRAWELVALALGINPTSFGRVETGQFNIDKIRDETLRHEFIGRLDDVKHALNSNRLPYVRVYSYGPQSWALYAGDFAAWARHEGWSLPSEFDGLACPSSSSQTGLTDKVAAPTASEKTIHSTKGKRKYPLTAEIEAARREATDPDDAHAVYTVLRQWAEQKKGPFIGFVQGEGIKYQRPNDERVYFLTPDALRKRMSRARNRPQTDTNAR
jgi:hypothetical protein